MASGSGNVSNVIALGGGLVTGGTTSGVGIGDPFVIPIGDIANYFTLSCGSDSSVSSTFYGFHKQDAGGSAQYQVTAGKTLISLGFWFTASTTTGAAYNFGAATASFTDGAGSVTGEDTYASTAFTIGWSAPTSTTGGMNWFPSLIKFGATKYPYVKYRTSGMNFQVVLLCKEI